jgi:hypothetical protein
MEMNSPPAIHGGWLRECFLLRITGLYAFRRRSRLRILLRKQPVERVDLPDAVV